MKKFYVVDYGIESDGKTTGCSSKYSSSVKEILEQNGWEKTGFDSTVWDERLKRLYFNNNGLDK